MGATRTRGEPTAETVTAAPAADACDTCPGRSLGRDSSHGYCEGCENFTRRCPGCRQDRLQAGWGWGVTLYGLIEWMCADCRWPPPPDVAGQHPRFAVTLDVDERGRFEVASVLDTASGKAGGGPAAWAIARMAAALRGGDGRSVDVDLVDVPLESRRAVDQVLSRLWWDHPTMSALKTLAWAWSGHVAECVPPPAAPAPPPSPAQVARERFGEKRKV